jgi:hypothetical protein
MARESAKGEGPEFKPQYQKKKKDKNLTSNDALPITLKLFLV